MCVCVYLVDDIDRVLQQESCSLPLVVDVGIFSQLLDLLFSRLAEQHLTTTQTHHHMLNSKNHSFNNDSRHSVPQHRHRKKELLLWCLTGYDRCLTFTHSPVAICLKVDSYVKLLRCVMEVLHSGLSAPHYYLSYTKVC